MTLQPKGGEAGEAERRRVAAEMLARHGRTLRRTARRFSMGAEDAEDAFQRALEILLVKAPPGEARELVRWMHTVIKHEALAIRRSRERQLGAPPPSFAGGEETVDWVTLIPAASAGPEERVERQEAIARSREALRSLKPAELRALTLLAEGYSYAEISELTGFSHTKVNRCLAEGRERFRAFLSRSEDGGRCVEIRPLLSAFCDEEAGEEDAETVREHLRACGRCRAVLRAYRAAPGAAAALAPGPLTLRGLLDRAHEAVGTLQARLPGHPAAADSTASQIAAAGGSRGAGMAAIAKILAICVGTAGGAAACVTAGVVPSPLALAPDHKVGGAIERVSPSVESQPKPDASYEPAVEPAPPPSEQTSASEPPPEPPIEAETAPAGAIEYAPSAAPPAPPPVAPATAAASPQEAGSAAGEFGP